MYLSKPTPRLSYNSSDKQRIRSSNHISFSRHPSYNDIVLCVRVFRYRCRCLSCCSSVIITPDLSHRLDNSTPTIPKLNRERLHNKPGWHGADELTGKNSTQRSRVHVNTVCVCVCVCCSVLYSRSVSTFFVKVVLVVWKPFLYSLLSETLSLSMNEASVGVI